MPVVSPTRRAKPRAATSTCEIPDKLYFKIGEVAELVGVETHVLRYWEKEIPFIRPSKTVSNQRRYRRKDVETFREIRRLLHDERYTLAGARRRFVGGDAVRDDAVEPSRVVEATPPEVAAPNSITETSIKSAPAVDRQLVALQHQDRERLNRLCAGLKDLIRLAGEEP